ncbi:MAG TPA: ABC transporter ATP-binding protein [Candidatus Limnocylindria bacterium]|nr:ABC transporter ATP-binding protein [Candidatus Limnocylindria bacterium]
MSLSLQDVGYRYAGASQFALQDVSLTLEPGQVLGIVGANGAGKSTLCLVAAGLAPATIGGALQGNVTIDGLTTAGARPDQLAQRCGILFQNPSTQISGTCATVWEEVAFGPRNLGLPIDDVVARVTAALAALAIAPIADRDPERLSGGQAQLVALAGVLALRPAYLVLDEPTSQLDPQGTHLVANAIGDLIEQTGAGVLVAEHKTDLLQRISRSVAVLVEGSIMAHGDAGTLLDDPRLEDWGIEPPSSVRIARAAQRAGVQLPAETTP